MLYPEGDFDVDGYYEQVRGNGVPIVSELKTEYWGDRVFSIKDADGYSLTFGVTVHHPSIEEIQEHMRAAPVSA